MSNFHIKRIFSVIVAWVNTRKVWRFVQAHRRGLIQGEGMQPMLHTCLPDHFRKLPLSLFFAMHWIFFKIRRNPLIFFQCINGNCHYQQLFPRGESSFAFWWISFPKTAPVEHFVLFVTSTLWKMKHFPDSIFLSNSLASKWTFFFVLFVVSYFSNVQFWFSAFILFF